MFARMTTHCLLLAASKTQDRNCKCDMHSQGSNHAGYKSCACSADDHPLSASCSPRALITRVCRTPRALITRVCCTPRQTLIMRLLYIPRQTLITRLLCIYLPPQHPSFMRAPRALMNYICTAHPGLNCNYTCALQMTTYRLSIPFYVNSAKAFEAGYPSGSTPRIHIESKVRGCVLCGHT